MVWNQMASDGIWDQKKSYEIRLDQMCSDETTLWSDEIGSNEIEFNQTASDETKQH